MGKRETEIPLKSSADQIWGGMKDSANLFPKVCPDRYRSAEIIGGDGKSAGSVILIKFPEGAPATFSKDKIEQVDEANKCLSVTVIEGEVTDLYKPFKSRFQVIPKGNGCSVKWCLDYEKAHEDAPEPEFAKKFTTDFSSHGCILPEGIERTKVFYLSSIQWSSLDK